MGAGGARRDDVRHAPDSGGGITSSSSGGPPCGSTTTGDESAGGSVVAGVFGRRPMRARVGSAHPAITSTVPVASSCMNRRRPTRSTVRHPWQGCEPSHTTARIRPCRTARRRRIGARCNDETPRRRCHPAVTGSCGDLALAVGACAGATRSGPPSRHRATRGPAFECDRDAEPTGTGVPDPPVVVGRHPHAAPVGASVPGPPRDRLGSRLGRGPNRRPSTG